MTNWTFITNHGLVLANVAKYPESTAREISNSVGITERSTHSIINDLEQEGYITRIKVGRHNKYRIHANVPLKDEITDSSVGELLAMLGWKKRGKKSREI
jgi:DNA-binding Lrp family transcriptional regulator